MWVGLLSQGVGCGGGGGEERGVVMDEARARRVPLSSICCTVPTVTDTALISGREGGAGVIPTAGLTNGTIP